MELRSKLYHAWREVNAKHHCPPCRRLRRDTPRSCGNVEKPCTRAHMHCIEQRFNGVARHWLEKRLIGVGDTIMRCLLKATKGFGIKH
jgi:hypothetical protein